MYCVILAAGKGGRMGILTKNSQKTMIGIRDKPKLVYTLENLPDEITDIIFIVGYKKEQIIDYFGDKYLNFNIKYVEQKELNGTGGAIKLAEKILKKEERFMVLMGDDFYRKKDLKKLLDYKYALLAFDTEDATRFGLIIKDEDGFVKSILEKPHNHESGLINTGAYMLTKDFFNYPLVFWSEKEAGLPQTLISMYPKYKMKIIITKHWLPMGNKNELSIAEEKINDFI